MKFGEHLIAHRASEWKKQYIQYEEMKVVLYNGLKRAPPLSPDMDSVKLYFANFEEEFFNFCQNELTKINNFYREKLSEAVLTLIKLQRKLEHIRQMSNGGKRTYCLTQGLNLWKPVKLKVAELTGNHDVEKQENLRSETGRRAKKLKLAFSEFYLSLVLIRNYQELNYNGYRKIFKKHDKLYKTTSGARWIQDHVVGAEFHTNKKIDSLIHQTEHIVTNQLEGGSRPKAMKQLRVIPPVNQHSQWTSFKIGLYLGIFLVLLTVLILTVVLNWSTNIDWYLVFQLYRGPSLLLIYLFLIGLNLYGWRLEGVNHVLIFELDPRNRLTEQQLFELATFFGLMWSISILSFIFLSRNNYSNTFHLSWPLYVNPLSIFIIIFILFMINPTKMYKRHARFWVLTELFRTMAAPFYEVKFSRFFIGCQLLSLVQIFLDFQYIVCMHVAYNGDIFSDIDREQAMQSCTLEGASPWIRALLAALPGWFRTLHCLRRYRDTRNAWPHLGNAIRYSTVLFVVLFDTLHLLYDEPTSGAYLYLWILFNLIFSGYGLFWDVHMDWGLFEKKVGQKRTFLREEMVYPSKWLYYFITIQDVILRFIWILYYFVIAFGYLDRDSMLSIGALIEMYRRIVWNFHRVENEHLNNCGRFRVVRDISLAHFADPRQIYRKRQSVVAEMAEIDLQHSEH